MARASDAFARAEFAAAVEAYDEAAAGEGLTRPQLLELLSGRAIAKHAERDVAGAEQDLVALLSLDPLAELGEMAPPALQRELARLRGELRGPLAIEVVAEPIPDGFVVRTVVREDLAALVRQVRVSWRTDEGWASATGAEVRVPVRPSLEYFAEAIGPGGAVLAQEGSEAEPLVARAAITAAPPVEAPPRGDDVPLIVGLTAGAVVIAAVVAIVLAVVLAPSGVQLSGPMELP